MAAVRPTRPPRRPAAVPPPAAPRPAALPAVGLLIAALLAAAPLAAAPLAAAPAAAAVAPAAGAAVAAVGADGPVPPVVRLEWEGEAGRVAAATCSAALAERGGAITAALLPPGRRPAPIRCLLLPSGRFAERFGAYLPDWGIGVALPGGRLVAIDIGRPAGGGRGLAEVFLHEVSHAVLEQATRGGGLPAWFHEGVALSLSGEWRFLDTVALILGGAIPSLDRLEGRFPPNATWADQAYRTSLLAVQRLESRHGPGAVRRIVDRVGAGEDFRDAFAAVTGREVEVFAGELRSGLRSRYGWLVMLTRWPALFVLLGLLFLLAAGARLIGRRRRLRELPE